MDKIKTYKYSKTKYWPLSKEQYVKWTKPENIFKRAKIISFVMLCCGAYIYFSFNQKTTALIFLLGGIAVLIRGNYFYKSVKVGKIVFEN